MMRQWGIVAGITIALAMTTCRNGMEGTRRQFEAGEAPASYEAMN